MLSHSAVIRLAALVTSAIAVTFTAVAQDAGAVPGEVTGSPTIITGDMLEVQGQRIRLAGIDAPEPGQVCRLPHKDYDCGSIAATALMDLTAGATVRCTLHRKFDNRAVLGRCFAEGYDLSEGMAYTGWALALPGEGGRYQSIEEGARSAGRGLWRGMFVKPWDWRRGVRLKANE